MGADLRFGLIPAHAGKTIGSVDGVVGVGAHPRSRGENAQAHAPAPTPGGSSPLTRGKLTAADVTRLVRGLIPAHAGKTSFSLSLGWFVRAHPRSRGENGREYDRRTYPEGSSPLTRGKRSAQGNARLDAGLIPAHAGKTSWRLR